MQTEDNRSYGQILESSSVIGGAAGVTLVLSMLRMKAVAVLVGPIGVGLIGTYQAIQVMVGTVAGLGIQSSAVRDVAEAFSRGEELAIGRTVVSLRRVCWITGLLGAVALVGLSMPLSRYTFGSDDYALDIALLGPAVFFATVQGGQMALIQGMRRIGDLARLNIIGATAATVLSLVLYAWLGLRGIIPSLVLIAMVQLSASWYFTRRIDVPAVSMSWGDSFRTANGMLRLGLVFMWNGLMVALVAFLTRAWITQEVSIEAVGIFTAAFSLSGMFINFVLGAMGADYFPRLTALAKDHGEMRRLVNEQTEIGLLLAVPGLLATLTLAPWIIRVLYTSEFMPAAVLLQWFILGCLGRVISWPMGFVMLALAKSRWFFVTETLFNIVHLGLTWVGLTMLGIEGVAIAFFGLYAGYIAVVYGVSRYLIGFSWSPGTNRLILSLFPIVAVAFLVGRTLPIWPSTIIGIGLTCLASILCMRRLFRLVGPQHAIVRFANRVPGVLWLSGVK